MNFNVPLLLVASTLVLMLGSKRISAESETVESLENKVSEQQVDPEVDQKPDPLPISPPAGHFPTVLALLEEGVFNPRFAFLADKATRTLSIWRLSHSQPEFIEAHPMDLGEVLGDKQVLGDKKTPEGIYFFENMYEGRKLNYEEYGSRAFVMDYPNFFDLAENKTGSGIWLHAIPPSKSLLRGSRGCVVVRDPIIKQISQYIHVGKTPIVVVDRAEYKPMSEYQGFTQQWKTWLQEWERGWESKSLEGYMDRYHSEFRSQGMDKQAWQRFKSGLSEKYEKISVGIKEPLVLIYGNQAVVRFLQDYESDKVADFGQKVLYLKKESGEFKILGEVWSPLNKELLAQKQEKIAR